MLTMSTISNLEYYSDLAAEDYYLDGGEPNGIWAGRGATLLGLRGNIDKAEYQRVMMGFSPSASERLCQNSGENHRIGWDLTFSAPKSVSVAWARADNALKEKIQQAQKRSVLAALSLLEEHAAVARTGKNGIVREATAGLVATLFEHCTSRAQDPQLHTHCLIANVAPRKDGTWGTIESRDLYLWQKAAGALYRAELAAELGKLNFAIEKDADSFKLRGIPKSICDYYSKRAAVIREALAEMGNIKSGSKRGDLVALSTREKKKAVNRSDLYRSWHKELDSKGFSEKEFASRALDLSKNGDLLWLSDSPEDNLDLCSEAVLDKLTEFDSVFRKQDVFKVAGEIAQWSGHSAREARLVVNEVLDDVATISLGMDHKFSSRFSTEEILLAEQEMVAGAQRLRKKLRFSISATSIAVAANQMSFRLSDEQANAVDDVCSPHSFAILQGSAGAGKSASMNCVRAAYQAEGFTVIGAAIARSAANNLAREAGLNAFTVAKLLSDIERRRSILNENTVVLIDEAGQLGARHLAKLVDHAEKSGCKLVLVGEDKQLDAIQHAGALRYLSAPEVLGTTRVETIRRQRNQWARQAVAWFRDGNSLAALKEHQNRGLLKIEASADDAKNSLIERWNHFRLNNVDKKTLVLAQRWSDVVELNSRIRKLLQADRIVSQKEIEVDCSVSDRHVRCAMAVGERVKFTQNDYRLGFTNGDLGTVLSAEKSATGDAYFKIKLDTGREVAVSASTYGNDKGHVYLVQAYALTVYSSQGLTVDGDTFVYYTTGMDRANTYVACSRHKDDCHVFANAKEILEQARNGLGADLTEAQMIEELAGHMKRENRKKLAIEYLEETGRQPVIAPDLPKGYPALA